MNFARRSLHRVPTAPLARQKVIILPSLMPLLRIAQTPIPRIITPILSQRQVRHESTVVGDFARTEEGKTDEVFKLKKPSYELTFTCKPCGRRSAHTITKQGYHYGSVLITCPGCHSRHVISDHLKIFSETARSFEEILAQSGETIQKYTAQRSYEEQLAAEDTLREKGIWSEGGNHVEVLPEEREKPTEEGWQQGLKVTPDLRPRAGAEVPGSGAVEKGEVVEEVEKGEEVAEEGVGCMRKDCGKEKD